MRFTVPQINEDSGRPQGIFVTAHALLKNADLSDEEEKHLRELLGWFEGNLPIAKSARITRRAIFWYHGSATARDCIQRMWELVNILRMHGYVIELQTCQRLGNVRYSDSYQVAAFPHPQDAPIITKTL